MSAAASSAIAAVRSRLPESIGGVPEAKEEPFEKPQRNLAVVFEGTEKMVVKDIGYPKFVDPRGHPIRHGVIVKVVATNICGSDLHMYRGRTSMPKGMAFGHEITGQVFELGADVETLKKGDLVSLPFNIACGRCDNCKERKTSSCLRADPDVPGAAFGYADMGKWQGGQAEYVLVPWADFNCLKLPNDDNCHKKLKDLAFLSDILPTAMNGCVQAMVDVGSTVYIGGAGPVGLCAVACSFLMGASAVVCGDVNPARLELAKRLGAYTVDLSQLKGGSTDSQAISAEIQNIIGTPMVDCSVDCVGYEACGCGSESGKNVPEQVINTCIEVTKPCGRIGVPGVYLPADPKGPHSMYKQGLVPIKLGEWFTKAQVLMGGQCPVMQFNQQLMKCILHNRLAVADKINTTIITLQEAPEAYKKFNAGEPVKYIIDPHGLLRQYLGQRP